MEQWGGCGLVFVGMLLDIVQTIMCGKKKEASAQAPKIVPADAGDDGDDEARDDEPLLVRNSLSA